MRSCAKSAPQLPKIEGGGGLKPVTECEKDEGKEEKKCKLIYFKTNYLVLTRKEVQGQFMLVNLIRNLIYFAKWEILNQ